MISILLKMQILIMFRECKILYITYMYVYNNFG